MAIEPVKIPTNIQVEERIIGPLSLRQIAIVLISSGFSYVLWTILKNNADMNIILHAISWSPTALGFAFSFVQVNGVSLFTIVLLMIEKMGKPPVRTFGPRSGISINLKTTSAQLEEEKKPKQTVGPDLSHLSSVLDAGIHREDVEGSTIPLDAIEASPRITPQAETEELEEDVLDWPGFSDDDDDAPAANGPLLRDIVPH